MNGCQAYSLCGWCVYGDIVDKNSVAPGILLGHCATLMFHRNANRQLSRTLGIFLDCSMANHCYSFISLSFIIYWLFPHCVREFETPLLVPSQIVKRQIVSMG